MRGLRALLLRLGGLFGKEPRECELADEMESHLQLHIEDDLRAGMSQAQARREAIMKLGGVEQTKESYRERLIRLHRGRAKSGFAWRWELASRRCCC
jgi:macrolide transport system ATP-binding/permease protein